MGAEQTVVSQMAILQTYGSAAIAAATSALSELAAIEIPYPSLPGMSINPVSSINPILGPIPAGIVIGEAPDIVEIGDVEKPDKPDIPEYELGDILEITLPDTPVLVIPEIDFEPPVYEISDPLPWAFEVGDILITNDPMIQAAMVRLKNNIAHGGTGLTPAIEDAIWNRDLERNEQQLSDSTDKITSMWAKKGFSLPDGLLANSLSDLQKEYMNKRIDRAREIAIKQAELEQSNLFKSLELSIKLASELINMLIKYEELVFRGQEATAKYANEYIDIQIKTYMSLVEAYKARAQTYEIIIRAEIVKIDLYKAQIQGQQAILAVNEQTVKIYSEKLKSTVILIDRYKSEVDAMTALLGVEKAKIEANKLQMDAWATEANVQIAVYNGKIEVYKASSQIGVSVAELQGRISEANLRANLAEAEIHVKSLESFDRIGMASANVRMEAAKGVAQSAATLAAGAVAAMSAHASLGYSESKALT